MSLYPQRCKVCGRRTEIEFHVTDDVWARVIPPPYRNNVVCLRCFDSFASLRNVDYADAIDKELSFDGDKASFTLFVQSREEAPTC